MNLVDYEKYYHSGSEFIIPRDKFEKIIEENQRLNNVLNELEKYLKSFSDNEFNYNFMVVRIQDLLEKLNELKGSDK